MSRFNSGELPDVAQFQVGDEEEHDHHNSQRHVVFPQSPGAVLYPQVVQVLLTCTPGGTRLCLVTTSEEEL